MSTGRPAVPTETKRALIREAGGKCANPGCSNHLMELHHIRQWAAYGTHDAAHMIALCPTCHAHVSRGELRIDDETLYGWKQDRQGLVTDPADPFYVEPGEQAKLLLGSIAVTGDAGLIVFEFAEMNRLSFTVKDDDILLLNLAITTRKREEVLRVTDGHVRRRAVEPVCYAQRPGRIRVTAPVESRFLPQWALYRVQLADAGYGMDGSLTLLDLEVVKPGLVRVQGIWTEGLRALVITRRALHHVVPGRGLPVSLMGEGEGSVLHYAGPITSALFGV
jgi:hypothetical protein